MRTTDVILADFEGYRLKNLAAGDSGRRSLTIIVDPVAGTTIYEVKKP